MVALLLLAAVTAFTPPRLLSGEPPGLPAPTVVGGGEVIVEATIDTSGNVSHAILLRDTPPYGDMLLTAIKGWRFTAAREPVREGVDRAVEAAVLVAAVYRPPTSVNGPTLGATPKDLSGASAVVPYPIAMPIPSYPPQAASGGVVLMEVLLDQAGIVRDTRTIHPAPPFDTLARSALSQWNFRGATVKSERVPSVAYIVMGFPVPIVPPVVQPH